MIDVYTWGWPQYTILALMFLGLALAAAHNGKPIPHNYSFPMKFCNVILWVFLLSVGGFFG